MDFIIALFIGFVILYKVWGEKHRGYVYNKYDNIAAHEVSDFFRKYAASEEELDKVKKDVYDRTPEVEKLRERLFKVIEREPTTPMLVFGMLAQKGKIPRLQSLNYYNQDNALVITQNWHWAEWEGSTDRKGTAMLEMSRLAFLKWYDKELERVGMHERLMWITPSRGTKNTYPFVYRPKDAKPISTCPDPRQGLITWLPMAHFFQEYLPEYEEATYRYDPAWWG